MTSRLVHRFLSEECDEFVRALLLDELEQRSSTLKYLTFNVFNVRLDFELEVVSVEDELDPDVAETLPLSEFRDLLERRRL